MDKAFMNYTEMAREARIELEHERERLTDKLERIDLFLQVMEHADERDAAYKKLQEENEMLQQQLNDERKQKAELEMKMNEMSKLSAGVAKKSSEEGVQKAIHTFVNYSKRKTSDKRTYIKNTILEFTSVNRISLPEELSATIDCLDDEQTEPKNVTMNGGVYNDIHDNKGVNYNSNI